MVILINTNIGSIDLNALRTIAHQALNLDLTISNKTKSESYHVLSAMTNNDISAQRHITFTFLLALPFNESLDFIDMCSRLPMSIWQVNRGDLMLITGSLDSWFDIITKNNIVGCPELISKVLSEIQNHIEAFDLVSIFSKYIKQPSSDGYCLRRV